MISNPHTAPADAYAPDADRAGPAMPENIARLLYVLRVMLDAGRHLAATMERRATTPGFWLFSAVFGTAKVPVILAYLRRAILRAAALESLLLTRAAAGRDVAAPPLPSPAAPGADANADPCEEQFAAQVARLTAERARHDAPIDPDKLATPEQIEAEVQARPIGRTFDEIRRDLGIVAGLCTGPFWRALTDAIACQESSTAMCLEDVRPGPACSRPPRQNDTTQQHDNRNPGTRHRRRSPNVIARRVSGEQPRSEESRPLAAPDEPDPFVAALIVMTLSYASLLPSSSLNPHRTPGFKPGELPVDPFRPGPALARPGYNVLISNRYATVAAAATGPPLRAALKPAA